MGFGLVVEISDGKIRPHCPERLGTAIGDAVLVGDAHNEAALSLERKQCHGVPPSKGGQRPDGSG
jgi:hypothetical protein